MVSPLLSQMILFNLAKMLPMNLENLEVIIIFKEQISQTVHFGGESIETLGTKIWDLIPEETEA